jgi:hypothetical protein
VARAVVGHSAAHLVSPSSACRVYLLFVFRF